MSINLIAMNRARAYRARAREAYATYQVPANRDEAHRRAFAREVYTPAVVCSEASYAVPYTPLGAGAFIADLTYFIDTHPARAEQLLERAAAYHWQQRQVHAYVDAYANRSCVVYIPAGVHLPQPLVLQELLGAYCGELAYESCMVVVEDDAHVVVHDQLMSTVRSLTYHLGRSARVECVHEYTTAHNVHTTAAYTVWCGTSSTFTAHMLLTGGAQINIWYDLMLHEPHAQATVRGVYLMHGKQQIELIAEQHHTAAHTHSDVRINGCLGGSARAAYYGRLYSAPATYDIVAQQRNDTILLSDKARALSIPSLEALAHQIQCAHGSAVAHVDEQLIRYVQARGISYEQARALVVLGFIRASIDGHILLTAAAERTLGAMTS